MLASLLVGCLCSFGAQDTLSQLRTQDCAIVNAANEVVALRGVNFGGWLMLETWVSGVEREWEKRIFDRAREAGVATELEEAFKAAGKYDDDTERVQDYIDRLHQALQARVSPEKYENYIAIYTASPPIFAAKDFDEALRRRFGAEGAARFWDAYHDTWFTEYDFMLAKALGFNFVRLPFWYRWFESDDAPGVWLDYGFAYLDRAVAWAEQNGLYVLLDFHGAPGGQSPWDHTGEMCRNEFFTSERCLGRTCALWRAIAARYKDRPAVFGYDTLNEPFSARDLEDWVRVQDALYQSIRAGDPDGIVVMEEGYKLEEMPYMLKGFFPKPEDRGWSNVMYSFHFYANDGGRAKMIRKIGLREQQRCNVPLYVGEFSTMSASPEGLAGMREYMTLFNDLGWAWSPWTFKYVDAENEGAMWGIYAYRGVPPRIPDVQRDSLDDLLAAVGRLGIAHFALQEKYAEIVRACVCQPVKR